MKRRNFLHNIPFLSSIPFVGASGASSSTRSFVDLIDKLTSEEPKDDAYWNRIKASFNLSPDYLDFNSAGLSPLTKAVMREYIDWIHLFYELPSKGVSKLRDDREMMIKMLATMVNCNTSELVFQRNATEALAAVIFGIPLDKGDEVIVSNYDYPHVYDAWKQRELRDGIVLKYAKIGGCPSSPKKIIKSYVNQISSKTKAVFITDLINYSGCQVPTKEIISALPDYVRYRIVDAAQSFANSRNDFKDFGATHVGTSLHKWLGAPAAGGLLYIQEDYISETWPLFAAPHVQIDKINKFSHLGTIDATIIPAVMLAIKFHEKIGAKNKHDRLMDLTNYFVDQAKKVKGLKIVSPRHRKLKSNIVVFSMDNLTTKSLHNKLWHSCNIHVTTSHWEDVNGVRVSMNISNSKSDIDRLVNCLRQL